jgi:hypothetical protein
MTHAPDRRHKHALMALGAFIGLLWLAMAAAALRSSVQGLTVDRPDWGLGWGLVGILLLAAGLSAIIGTWNHQYRVLKDE